MRKNEGTEQVGDLIRNFSKTMGQAFGRVSLVLSWKHAEFCPVNP